MSVVVETTLGDITVDLFVDQRPYECQNFLKLCTLKYYDQNLFHTVSKGYFAATGDPTGTRNGGESIFGVLHGSSKRFYKPQREPRIRHNAKGLISFIVTTSKFIGSQFLFTLGKFTKLACLREMCKLPILFLPLRCGFIAFG